MPKTTRYLITGGAGFLGINLARFLLASSYQVTSLDIAEFNYLERQDVQVIRGDVRDRSTVERALEGVDVVVHAAAALALCSPEEIYSTEVDGTLQVLESAYQKGIGRVVHISSGAVYGTAPPQPTDENAPLESVGPYGESKIAAERICLEYRAKEMCIPILRPNSFIGPERLGIFSLLYDWAYDGKNFPVLGNGKNLRQFLDVEDMCQAIFLSATVAPEKANETFNVGAKKFGTIQEDFQAVLDEAGHGKRVVTLPAKPAILVLRVLEQLRMSPLYGWVYETADKDSVMCVRKAEEMLGFSPVFSNRDALIRNYRWYLENRSRIQSSSGFTHREVWKQKALRLAKAVF